MRYDLPLERTAAVVHLQALLMTSRLMHIWMDKLLEERWSRAAYEQVVRDLRDVKSALDIRDDIWQVGGYNIGYADQGLYKDIEMRNRTFACIHDFITTTSDTQMGQGGEAYEHIEQWNVPLLPKDARRPPAQLEPQPWDPSPIVMMTPAQIQAEQMRRQAEEEAQAQSAPDPTAHPTSSAGGGSASSSSAGQAPPRKAPPTKARPKEPSAPPDWIVQKPPDGCVYRESQNNDYRGTPFTTSL
eukprot:s3097_g4.t1